MASTDPAEPPSPVVVSLSDLKDGSVPFSSLEQAFGPSSLGIIIVKDLAPRYAELRRRVLSYSSYLGNLPAEELVKLEDAQSKYLTGWSLGKEKLKSNQPDTLKGSYYVNCAFYLDPALQGAPTEGPGEDGETRDFSEFTEYTAPNVWPAESVLPGFRDACQELCTMIIDVATLVAQACDRFAEANIAGYEPGYLEKMVKTSMTTKARLLHYFPPDQSSAGEDEDDWCATHVDHGCLTGLTSAMYVDESDQADVLKATGAQTNGAGATETHALPPLEELPRPPDSGTGLYILSRTSTTTKVSIPRDCLAFQTGESLELITQGRFKAVPHFVRGLTGDAGDAGTRVARNTLAVFTQPNLWEIVDADRRLDYAGFAREVVSRHY